MVQTGQEVKDRPVTVVATISTLLTIYAMPSTISTQVDVYS